MASVHCDILSTVFLTAALFHLQHRTHYLFSSSSKLWFYPHFRVPSHEGLMVREGAVGSREEGWAVHGEISQWGLIMCGEWGKIYFRTRNPLPQHAQAHTFYERDVRSLCNCAGSRGCMMDRWTPPHSYCDCEHLLKLLSLDINLQCDPWAARGSKTPREDDLRRPELFSVSK